MLLVFIVAVLVSQIEKQPPTSSSLKISGKVEKMALSASAHLKLKLNLISLKMRIRVSKKEKQAI